MCVCFGVNDDEERMGIYNNERKKIRIQPNQEEQPMTNVFCSEGILSFILLFICSCAYFRYVPRIKGMMENRKKGLFGVFFKASVIGIRLHYVVSLTCFITALYLFFK